MTREHKPTQPADACELTDLESDYTDTPAPWWQRFVWAVEDVVYGDSTDPGVARLLALAIGVVLVAVVAVAFITRKLS